MIFRHLRALLFLVSLVSAFAFAEDDPYGEKAKPKVKSLEELGLVATNKNSPRVLVAVMDSGVDYNHPDLATKISRLDPGIDLNDGKLLGGSLLPFPFEKGFSAYQRSHGTHVAGIIAAENDNVELTAIRREEFGGVSYAKGVDYAAKKKVKIINMSFGSAFPTVADADGYEDWEPLKQSIKDHPEILFVIAAGNAFHGKPNDNDKNQVPPASFNFPNVITVGSVDASGNLAAESNYGKKAVTIGALGVNVESSAVGGGKIKLSGTSMAAPQVSRVASKILALDPSLTPVEVIEIIKKSSQKKSKLSDKFSTGGILDEAAALKLTKKIIKDKARSGCHGKNTHTFSPILNLKNDFDKVLEFQK